MQSSPLYPLLPLDRLSSTTGPKEHLRPFTGRDFRLKRPRPGESTNWDPLKQPRLVRDAGIHTLRSRFDTNPLPTFRDVPLMFGGNAKMVKASDTSTGFRNTVHSSVVSVNSPFNQHSNDLQHGWLLFNYTPSRLSHESVRIAQDRMAGKQHFLRLIDVNQQLRQVADTKDESVNRKWQHMTSANQVQACLPFMGVSLSCTKPIDSSECGALLTRVVDGDALIKNYWEGCPAGFQSGSRLWLVLCRKAESSNSKFKPHWQLLPIVMIGAGSPTREDVRRQVNHSDIKQPSVRDSQDRWEYTGRAIQVGIVVDAKGMARSPSRMRLTSHIAMGLWTGSMKRHVDINKAIQRLNMVRIAVKIKYT
jgi:hypothetical protein